MKKYIILFLLWGVFGNAQYNLFARQNFAKSVSLPTYNTYIGGVASTISTPALLATKLGIDVSRISNFSIVGSDIKCRITGSYTLLSYNFNTSTVITYYDDFDGLVTSIRADTFAGPALPMTRLWMPGVTSVLNGAWFFYESIAIKTIYLPRCTSFGNTIGNDSTIAHWKATGVKMYVSSFLQTCNSGSPDGDIATLVSNGVSIVYVTNFTAPNPITNLSAGTIYNTAIQLNFTPPSSTNTIDYYECYANGVLKNTITASGQYITGLTPNTNYNITIKAVDIFYNKSVASNSLSVSTTNNSWDITTGLVSYYKLDSNSNDSFGSNNGTDTSVSYVTGKIGNAGSFNGSSSNISIADNNNLSFTNGSGVDTPFSFSFWLKLNNQTDQWLVNKRGVASGTDEYQVVYYQGKLSLWLFSSNNANYINCVMTSALLSSTQYYITATYDGSETTSGLKIYVNGVLQTTTNTLTGTYTGMPNGIVPVVIGKTGWGNLFYLNGTIDETAIYNIALTQTEIDLLYNSGNGITL